MAIFNLTRILAVENCGVSFGRTRQHSVTMFLGGSSLLFETESLIRAIVWVGVLVIPTIHVHQYIEMRASGIELEFYPFIRIY